MKKESQHSQIAIDAHTTFVFLALV
jgi:hypothetical protein